MPTCILLATISACSPIFPSFAAMKLSVIIPVYNEAKTIAELIRRVQAVGLDKEIVLVDDGSKDETYAIAKTFEGADFTAVRHPVNQGKGAAIRTALQYVKGDVVIIQDGDLETEPQDYVHLVQPIIEGKAKVVYGSRNLNPTAGNRYWLYDFGGRFISLWTNILYKQNITDEAACYKVFRTEIIKSIPLTYNRFEFCPEVTARVSKLGIKIYELPMHYYPRSFAEGKKMKWTDGLKAFWVLLKLRFTN